MNRGEEIHGVLDSADASTGAAVTLYRAGTSSARTLESNEQLVVTDLLAVLAPGGAMELHFGSTAGTGNTVAAGTVGANGGYALSLSTPHVGPKATNLYVTAAAGQVDVVVKGYIIKL